VDFAVFLVKAKKRLGVAATGQKKIWGVLGIGGKKKKVQIDLRGQRGQEDKSGPRKSGKGPTSSLWVGRGNSKGKVGLKR